MARYSLHMSFDAYILCTSPRSGSTLLINMLATTGVAGDPGSFFHRDTAEGWAEALGIAPSADRQALLKAIFAAVLPKGRGQSDVFGMRLQAHSLDRFLGALAELHPEQATDKHRIERVFGPTAFIYLHRDSALERAVSYLRARQSGVWHMAADGTVLERKAAEVLPGYDAHAIATQIEAFEAYDAAWEDWFSANAITPHRVDYDALNTDPRSVLADVLTALALDPKHAQDVSPGTRKLADATSQDWMWRYLNEHP